MRGHPEPGAQTWAHRGEGTRSRTRAHRGEGTRSPDAGTQGREHMEPRRRHTAERAHGAQTQAHRGEGTGSPDVGTQGRGHREPRRGHSGEGTRSRTWAHREEGTRSPDADIQGRGQREPRRGHTGERAHRAQTWALRGEGTRSPEPRCRHVYKAPSVLCLWDSVLKMPFAVSCHKAPAHKGVPSTLSSNITAPWWPSKAGPSIWLLPCTARSTPPRSSHLLPGWLQATLPAAPTPPSSHSYTRGPGGGPRHSTWLSVPLLNSTPALQEATVPWPRLGRQLLLP